jgi:hypothetical protein
VVPSQGGRARLCEKLGWKQPDRFQIRWFSVVGGAAGAGTWGQVSSGTFHSVRGTSGDAVDGVCPLQEMARQKHHIWSGMLEQGPDRQRAPRCCSGGVSSIDGASESRCSHDGPGSGCQQGLQHFRHWSSLKATRLDEGGCSRQSNRSKAEEERRVSMVRMAAMTGRWWRWRAVRSRPPSPPVRSLSPRRIGAWEGRAEPVDSGLTTEVRSPETRWQENRIGAAGRHEGWPVCGSGNSFAESGEHRSQALGGLPQPPSRTSIPGRSPDNLLGSCCGIHWRYFRGMVCFQEVSSSLDIGTHLLMRAASTAALTSSCWLDQTAGSSRLAPPKPRWAVVHGLKVSWARDPSTCARSLSQTSRGLCRQHLR